MFFSMEFQKQERRNNQQPREQIGHKKPEANLTAAARARHHPSP
jgi:hypothetical protein